MKTNSLLLLVPVLALLSCGPDPDESQQIELDVVHFVDCETVEDDHFLANSGAKFSNVNRRTDTKAYSGEYSLHLDQEHQFGLGIDLDVKPGQHLYISCMNQGGGTVNVQYTLKSTGALVTKNRTMVDSLGDGGWHKQYLIFTVPDDLYQLKVFCYNGDATDSYWDDLRLEVHSQLEPPAQEEVLQVYIEDKHMTKLDKWKAKAIEKGIISKKFKKYVPAKVTYAGETYEAKVRIKGDWTDHLQNWKMSYRVKLDKDKFIKGMNTFSIQDPATRWYLMEFMAHKLMEKEGLLTTKYEMVPVSVNGTYKGVYAMEQHFDKYLLEGQKRREAPIVRYDEQGMWNGRMAEVTEDSRMLMASAPVLPFKEGRTLKDEGLRGQFFAAGQLMEDQRLRLEPTARTIDLTKYARMTVVTELLSSRHGMIWHNLRFYYNPIKGELEVLGFDVYGGNKQDLPPSFLLHELNQSSWPSHQSLHLSAMRHPEFLEEYVEYYEKLIDPEYLQEFKEEFEKENARTLAMIEREYGFGVWWEILEFRQQVMRKELQHLKEFAASTREQNKLKFVERYPMEKGENEPFVEGLNMQAYHLNDTTLEILSYYPKAIDIHSYRIDKGNEVVKLPTPVKLTAYEAGKKKSVKLSVPAQVDEIYFNCGEELECDILPWQKPSGMHPRLALEADPSARLAKPGDSIVWSGSVTIDKLMWLPTGASITVMPGCSIHLEKGAGLVIDGRLDMNGTASNPIQVTTEGVDNHGIQYLRSPMASLSNVMLTGLNTLRLPGWTLTGGLTFNECDVTLKNVTLIDNHCEDALNTVRSTVDIDGLHISGAYADAYDSDWCTGDVHKVTITRPGNDGLDFSGSEITVHHVAVKDPGDKAISAGEASTIKVLKAVVNGGRMGLVSKDQSSLDVDNAEVENIDIASLVAFQKKGEFGSSELIIGEFTGDDTRLIEKGSKLRWKGQVLAGKDDVDLEALYAPFEK